MSELCTPQAETQYTKCEKLFMKLIGNTPCGKNFLPTVSTLRTLGDNIYLLDYKFDYDTEKLMKKGAASAAKLFGYASRQTLGGMLKFKPPSAACACSAFEAHNEKGEHIMGRNFDYMDGPCYLVWTHKKGAYASVSTVDANFLLTFDRCRPKSIANRLRTLPAPYFCLDGMNEKGLSIAVLQIHENGTKQNTGKVKMFVTAMVRLCLDKCATVNEAIELFNSFDLQDTVIFGYSLGCCFHYMLTDAEGDAAVIEYVNNEIRIIRAENPEGARLAVTNFYLSGDGGAGSSVYDPEGNERYDMIMNALRENANVMSFDKCFDLLSDIHLNYRHKNNLYDITTLWSLVFNNDRRTVSISARMDYSKIYTFNVTEPQRLLSEDSVKVSMPIEGCGLH